MINKEMQVSRIATLLVTLSLALALFTACNSRAPKVLTVNDQDGNRAVQLDKGDILEVSLAGNPTTGFTWEPQGLASNILQQKGEGEFKPSAEKTPLVGAPGKMILRFEAVGAGQTNLQLVYHQAFDKATPPAQNFQLTVTVK